MRTKALLAAAVLLAPLTAHGHPGGLNSSGCHRETATGGYHCHNSPAGDSAGQNGYINIQPVRQQPRPRANTIYASPGQYAVISVGDGDTIRIRTSSGKSVTVRLACIDAPETAQGQSGRDSTDQLRALLSSAGGVVQLQPKETDRYGRTVAEVLAAGRNVNLELVRLGAAYVYRDYLRGCNASAYTQAENEARTSRAGVWQYVMEYPWDFRKSRRK